MKIMWKMIIVILMACSAGVLALMVWKIPIVSTAENKMFDWRLRLREVDPSYAKEIVVVLIDDASLQNYPYRSPLPRNLLATLIRILHTSGAKLIGLDIFLKDLTWEEEDRDLEEAMRTSGRVVLVSVFRKEQGTVRLDLPHPKFFDAALATGLGELPVDPVDGVVRKYQTFFQIETQTLPTLAMRLYLIDQGIEVPESKSIVKPLHEEVLPTGIPLDRRGSFYINYQAPPFKIASENNPLKIFPASAVMTGFLPSEWFENAIVLIGAGFGDSKDDLQTPYYSGAYDYVLTPGVEIHANGLATLRSGNTVKSSSSVVTFLTIFFFSFAIIFCVLRLRPFIACVIFIGCLVGWSLFAVWMFTANNYVIALVPFGIGLALAYIESVGYQAATEGRQKRWIKNAFEMYVSSDVVNLLVRNPDKLHLGGELREISILFSDLANFTRIAENLSSEELVMLLNRYFDGMTEIILKHGGTLDKYIGDAIMAFWNAPLSQQDHALRAAHAALEMQAFSEKFSKTLTAEGKSAVTTRIGLNTGKVVVGNIGARKHFNYTIMGDHVNLASRLEGANKAFGTFVMISEFMFERIHGTFRARELDLLRVKGKEKPVRVYELLARSEQQFPKTFEQMLQCYEQGLRAYRQRDWETAIAWFEGAIQSVPDDQPSRLYLERSKQMQAHPPDSDWDGVCIMRTK